MIKLNVWLTLDEKTTLHAGELIVADPDFERGGLLKGQFRYTQEYLSWKGAFALDPIHLPLSQEIYNADRPGAGVHGVFEDSLPDDWGRRLLSRKHSLSRHDLKPPQLLRCLAGDGMGALSYNEKSAPPKRKELLGSHYLGELQSLAAQFEEDVYSVDSDIALLFQAGSSPGGARPKVLIQHDDIAYIAKFKSINDRFDVVSLEAAAMELARRADVDTPPTHCVDCGTNKVLLVKRFDINPKTSKKKHVITMQTLLGADGHYYHSYRDLADIIRKVSTDPVDDLKKMFKQLVFNVLIGNTDDHLKNFSMVCDGKTWKLSPAYDLVPNIGQNREHVLSINFSNFIPDRTSLLKEANYFGLKHTAKANNIIDSVVFQVESWQKVFQEFEVPQKDIAVIGRDIASRLARVCS